MCYSPWGRQESDPTQQMNNSKGDKEAGKFHEGTIIKHLTEEAQSTGHHCLQEVWIIYTFQMEKQSPLTPDHYSELRLLLHLNLQSLGHGSLAYQTRHWKSHKRASTGKMACIEKQQFVHELLPTSLCTRWCGMKRDWEPDESKIICKQNFHLGLYRPSSDIMEDFTWETTGVICLYNVAVSLWINVCRPFPWKY